MVNRQEMGGGREVFRDLQKQRNFLHTCIFYVQNRSVFDRVPHLAYVWRVQRLYVRYVRSGIGANRVRVPLFTDIEYWKIKVYSK